MIWIWVLLWVACSVASYFACVSSFIVIDFRYPELPPSWKEDRMVSAVFSLLGPISLIATMINLIHEVYGNRPHDDGQPVYRQLGGRWPE